MNAHSLLRAERLRKTFFTLTACGALILAAAGMARAVPAGLSPQAIVQINTLATWRIGALSTDGRWLAYVVRSCKPPTGQQKDGHLGMSGMRADDEGCADMWVADTRTGEVRRITEGGMAAEPAWSPDGSQLAFYSATDGTAKVHVWDRQSGQVRKVSDERVLPSYLESVVHMKWTPDGKHLIVPLRPWDEDRYGPQPVTDAAQTPAIGSENTAAAGATVRVFDATRLQKKRSAEAGRERALQERVAGSISREVSQLAQSLMVDLASMDVQSGAVRRLSGKKPVFWFSVSPDGNWLAYSLVSGFKQDQELRTYDVEVVPVGGGAVKALARDTLADQGVCLWSPNSRSLAYIVGLDLPAVADIHLLDVAGDAHRRLTPGTTTETATWNSRSSMYWTPDGTALVFEASDRLWRIEMRNGRISPLSPVDWPLKVVELLGTAQGRIWSQDGGRTVTVMTRDAQTKEMGFYRIDTAGGVAVPSTPARLLSEAKAYGYGLRNAPMISADGSTLLYLSQSAQSPADIWTAGPGLSSPRQLTRLNPQLSGVPVGAPRLMHYRGSEGEALGALLLLPADYREGQRVPVVVKLYPTMGHADRMHEFSGENQILASRGYAVLDPDIPRRVGAPMASLSYHTNAAVNQLIDLGIADPDRIGVMGHSHGGYAAIAVMTQSERYKAAVMSAGFADLTSFYGELQDSGLDAQRSWAETGNGAIGGSLWQFRDRFIENSPIYYLDRVRAPVLILHGDEDKTVRAAYADQVFSGLRLLGVPTQLRKYAGEGHGIAARENYVDYWDTVVRWFDTYLVSDTENSGNQKENVTN